MIHIFVPSRIQSASREASEAPGAPPRSSRRARSVIDTTSEPAPLSLIASAPTVVPAIRSGRYFARWASVPFLAIWLMHRFEWAP